MRRLLLTLLLLVAVAACGDDGDGTSGTTAPPGSSATTVAPSTTSGGTTTVRAYFLRDEKVGPVARTADGPGVASAALEALLAGPTEEEAGVGFSTTIPEGTELLGVTVEGGVATVDLSDEFAGGGGSLSMMGRVAEVVFTATQFPTVDGVAFQLEGEPLEVLGGEGLILDGPQTRADWEGMAPAILVESPLPFASVSSPLRVSGTANTFEAVFRLNVTDGEGLIVYDESVQATSGSGTRGDFDVTATFEVSRPGAGEVIVFEESAENGEPIHVVEIPVQIS